MSKRENFSFILDLIGNFVNVLGVFVRARFKVQYTKHTGDSFAFVGFFLHWSIFQIHNQCQLQSPLVINTDFSQFHKFNKFWKLLVFLEGTKQMGLSQPN